MTKKQIIKIAAAAFITVLAAVSYFAFVKPWIESLSPVPDSPVLLPGEELGTSGRYYMFSSLERSEMKTIEVTNSLGTYTFVHDGADSFYIDGYEDVGIDGTLLSELVVTCGASLTKTRVTDNADAEKLAEYGLDEPQACWTVTDNGGKQYRVYVGRELLTGGGYYCMFAGRNSVYVIDNTVAETVLCPVESYVIPYVLPGISSDDYYKIDDFTVFRGSDKLIEVGIVDRNKMENKDALVENILTYPVPYTPDSEKLFGVYMGFASLTGDSTYRLDPGEKDIEECGLVSPDFAVSFDYNGTEYRFLAKKVPDENSYYVISNVYGIIISKVSAESLKFLDYGIMDWVSPYIFRRYLSSLEELYVETDNVKETFYIHHGTDGSGNETMSVGTSGGKVLSEADDVLNFRHYYGTLISLAVQDYVPDTVPGTGESMDDFTEKAGNCVLTLKYRDDEGKIAEYKFYRYTSRHCAASLDGRCDFYVLNDVIEKIENDTVKLLAGETVDPYSPN